MHSHLARQLIARQNSDGSWASLPHALAGGADGMRARQAAPSPLIAMLCYAMLCPRPSSWRVASMHRAHVTAANGRRAPRRARGRWRRRAAPHHPSPRTPHTLPTRTAPACRRCIAHVRTHARHVALAGHAARGGGAGGVGPAAVGREDRRPPADGLRLARRAREAADAPRRAARVHRARRRPKRGGGGRWGAAGGGRNRPPRVPARHATRTTPSPRSVAPLHRAASHRCIALRRTAASRHDGAWRCQASRAAAGAAGGARAAGVRIA